MPNNDSHSDNSTTPNYIELWQKIYSETIPMYQDFLTQYEPPELLHSAIDFEDFNQTFNAFWGTLINNPEQIANMQQEYWHRMAKLWQDSAENFFKAPHNSSESAPYDGTDFSQHILETHLNDRRFKDEVWQQSAIFDFIKKSYFLTSDWLMSLTYNENDLDQKTQQKIQFYMKHYVDAIAPTNFALTNPEVLRETLETGGENLIHGFQNLLRDLKRGHGHLNISTSNQQAFKIGSNLATTPGKVLFENELIQLIHYEAKTEKQFETPLLIIPPFINKYYLLDLKEENSFVRWALNQGHSVYLVSWVNPDEKLKDYKFDDYMERGLLTALEQVEQLTGQKQTNLIGYCIGGTLLSITLSWLKAKYGDTSRIKSATFFTTLIDFKNSGELNLFIDEKDFDEDEKTLTEDGYLHAKALQHTFSLLRANDLIWSFVINNYLLGKEPFPFDLLYWNDDPTNLPAALHRQYLLNMYLKNKLAYKNRLSIKGQKIDVTCFDTPSHFVSAKDDHIAPWVATHQGAQKIQNKTFTLAGSGHIAGIVNPPNKNKYGYWTNAQQDKNTTTTEEWLEGATHHEGSWWTHWGEWIAPFGGRMVKARSPMDHADKIIEDAPGRYVQLRAEDIDI